MSPVVLCTWSMSAKWFGPSIAGEPLLRDPRLPEHVWHVSQRHEVVRPHPLEFAVPMSSALGLMISAFFDIRVFALVRQSATLDAMEKWPIAPRYRSGRGSSPERGRGRGGCRCCSATWPSA